MANSPAEMEVLMMEKLLKETGKDYKAWVKLLDKEGPEGFKQQLAWLREEKGLKYSLAQIITAILKNDGEPVYGNPEKLITEQYSGKTEGMRPVFEKLKDQILKHYKDAELHVCKGYVSFVAKRQFATIIPGRGEVKLGLGIKDHPISSDLIQPLKGAKPSDKISHYISITEEKDISKEVLSLVGEVKVFYT